jgi:hypothetical protein
MLFVGDAATRRDSTPQMRHIVDNRATATAADVKEFEDALKEQFLAALTTIPKVSAQVSDGHIGTRGDGTPRSLLSTGCQHPTENSRQRSSTYLGFDSGNSPYWPRGIHLELCRECIHERSLQSPLTEEDSESWRRILRISLTAICYRSTDTESYSGEEARGGTACGA